MALLLGFVAVTATTLSFLITIKLIARLKRENILAIANHRSSHTQATPAGGGLAISIVTLSYFLFSLFFVSVSPSFLIAYLPSAIVVIWVGFLDDIKGLQTRSRLIAYTLCAAWATWFLQPPTEIIIDEYTVIFGYFIYPAACIFLIWVTNLFNFMDGINGLVTSQTFVFGICFLVLGFGLELDTFLLILIFSAACLGFLPLNFPKARVFLGDVGSIFMGFTVAVTLVHNSNQPRILIPSLIILIPLFVDATLTFALRLARGENVLHGHNKHLYQRINILINSHTKTTLLYCAFSVFILAPLAAFARLSIHSQGLILFGSYLFGCIFWCFAYWRVEQKIKASTTFKN